MALVLGISSSNLRREQLNYTLGTMGIMAHELRTPLATMSLIGDAVRSHASPRPENSQTLEQLAARLHALVRNMNHQIDTQIANARLMRLPPVNNEAINAADLVSEAVTNYPYRSTRERESVVVRVHGSFLFKGSHDLFLQVIDNLLKNALRSLAAARSASQPGDVLIEVKAGSHGQIIITDRGVGMDPKLQDRIFEPFFSTDRGTGHGLGLAFCQRMIQGAGGSIRVRSELLQGASFIVELPSLSQAQ
jgi:two-component system, CAI-1 autoinducer sensor kinase/phosphatase CqsS